MRKLHDWKEWRALKENTAHIIGWIKVEKVVVVIGNIYIRD